MHNNHTLKGKSRRQFFKQFAAETVSLVEEICGKPQYRLSELHQLPESTIQSMVPVFNGNIKCKVQNDCLVLKTNNKQAHKAVLHLSFHHQSILEKFGTGRSLEQIATCLTGKSDEDFHTIYQQVRKVFLLLAKHNICHPVHAIAKPSKD